MISELEFESFDSEVDQLFRDAEADECGMSANEPDEDRVERIVEKARHEAVIKDTMTFLFRSFAPALGELMVALLRVLTERAARSCSETASPSIDSRCDPGNSTSPTDPDRRR